MDDHELMRAEAFAVALGLLPHSYSTTSDLIGLFCQNVNGTIKGCVVNTEEFGLMFMADAQDLNCPHLANNEIAKTIENP